MGWLSGTKFAEETYISVREYLPVKERYALAKRLYKFFSSEDADGWHDDMQIIKDMKLAEPIVLPGLKILSKEHQDTVLKIAKDAYFDNNVPNGVCIGQSKNVAAYNKAIVTWVYKKKSEDFLMHSRQIAQELGFELIDIIDFSDENSPYSSMIIEWSEELRKHWQKRNG